jgi:hypothetical protein
MPIAPPRLYPTTAQNKGGYFLDQNSGWPTWDANYDSLAKTGGICTLCHGTDVDNMDYYTSEKLWRPSQTNGHANSTIGGTGAGSASATDIFDARRGRADGEVSMWMQDLVPNAPYNKWGDVSGYGGINYRPQNQAPMADMNQPGDGSLVIIPRNTGWYGGTAGSKPARGSQFATWYGGGIGNSGRTGATRAHDFTCSKCHQPHAGQLPALLITNCLDTEAGTWVKSQGGNDNIGPKSTSTWGRRAMGNCHRKEYWTGRDTGWNYLAPGE